VKWLTIFNKRYNISMSGRGCHVQVPNDGEVFTDGWLDGSGEYGTLQLQLYHPLSSDRQHLSYDVCLEVQGEIIRTVLCCIVY